VALQVLRGCSQEHEYEKDARASGSCWKRCIRPEEQDSPPGEGIAHEDAKARVLSRLGHEDCFGPAFSLERVEVLLVI